jgi:hypothetical protein
MPFFAKWNFVQRIICRIDQLEQVMSDALTSLKGAIADANASFSAELDAINAKLGSFANGATVDEINEVTASVRALKDRIDTETSALTGNGGGDGTGGQATNG